MYIYIYIYMYVYRYTYICMCVYIYRVGLIGLTRGGSSARPNGLAAPPKIEWRAEWVETRRLSQKA